MAPRILGGKAGNGRACGCTKYIVRASRQVGETGCTPDAASINSVACLSRVSPYKRKAHWELGCSKYIYLKCMPVSNTFGRHHWRRGAVWPRPLPENAQVCMHIDLCNCYRPEMHRCCQGRRLTPVCAAAAPAAGGHAAGQVQGGHTKPLVECFAAGCDVTGARSGGPDLQVAAAPATGCDDGERICPDCAADGAMLLGAALTDGAGARSCAWEGCDAAGAGVGAPGSCSGPMGSRPRPT